jgi:hypothetical protein
MAAARTLVRVPSLKQSLFVFEITLFQRDWAADLRGVHLVRYPFSRVSLYVSLAADTYFIH